MGEYSPEKRASARAAYLDGERPIGRGGCINAVGVRAKKIFQRSVAIVPDDVLRNAVCEKTATRVAL